MQISQISLEVKFGCPSARLWRGKFLETPPKGKKHGFNHTFSQLWEIPTSVSSMVSICLFCSERTRTCSSWRVERAAGENMVKMCLPWPSGVVFTIEQFRTAPACINTEQHLYTLPPKWLDSTQYIAAILIRSPTNGAETWKIENRVNQIPFCFST